LPGAADGFTAVEGLPKSLQMLFGVADSKYLITENPYISFIHENHNNTAKKILIFRLFMKITTTRQRKFLYFVYS